MSMQADAPTQSESSHMNTNTCLQTQVEHENGTVSTAQHASPVDYQKIVDKLHNLGIERHNSRDEGAETICQMLKPPQGSPDNSLSINGTDDVEVSECQPSDTLVSTDEHGFKYHRYQSELQMPDIMSLISKDLSEPYSIYTYRYFIHNWPDLCFLAMEGCTTIGAIVCKLDPHKRTMRKRGYIAMLAIDHSYRRKRIGSKLVSIAIEAMVEQQADEIVLETEVTNLSALRLYEKLGFVRDKRLYKYYLNGVDAFRLKLWLS